MAITVFFFDPDWTILQTQSGTGVEAAIVARTAGKVAKKGTGRRDNNSGVDPEGHCRDRGFLIRQAGPSALRTDVPSHRVGAPQKSKLRIRLGASKRHGKRCASAQQIATFHPLTSGRIIRV